MDNYMKIVILMKFQEIKLENGDIKIRVNIVMKNYQKKKQLLNVRIQNVNVIIIFHVQLKKE